MTAPQSVHGEPRTRRVDARDVEAFTRRVQSRRARFDLRDTLRKVTHTARLAGCGRHVTPGAPGVEVRVSAEGAASFGNLQMCGSVWACPVCSAKIRQARADEIAEGADRWLRAGHGLVFVTLTIPHDRGDGLGPLLDTIANGWRSLLQGREWVETRKRLGVVGYVRSLEITHGANGWHPHVHAVIATETVLSDDELAELGDRMHSRWAQFVVGRGYRAPSREHGVDCQRARSGKNVGDYLVKVQDQHGQARSLGLELTRHDLKRGRRSSRTAFEVLEQAAVDPVDRALWLEYEEATKGRRCLTWSRGLRALWSLGADVDDELLAEADEGPGLVTVAVLTDAAWRLVLSVPGGRHKLLTAAEVDGDIGVNRVLEAFGSRPYYAAWN